MYDIHAYMHTYIPTLKIQFVIKYNMLAFINCPSESIKECG